jgi:hypothetical protein
MFYAVYMYQRWIVDRTRRGVVLGVDRTLRKQVLRDGSESAGVGFGDGSESGAKLPKLSKRVLWFQSIFLIYSVLVWFSLTGGTVGSWLHSSLAYSYICNQCLLPLTLWVRTAFRRGVLDTVCDKVCQWLAKGWWFSPGTLVSSTNKHKYRI